LETWGWSANIAVEAKIPWKQEWEAKISPRFPALANPGTFWKGELTTRVIPLLMIQDSEREGGGRARLPKLSCADGDPGQTAGSQV